MLEIDFGQEVVSVRIKPRAARKRSHSDPKIIENSPKRIKHNKNTHKNNNVPAVNNENSNPKNQLNSFGPANKIVLEKKSGRPTRQATVQDNDSNSNSIKISESNQSQLSADPMLYCYCRKNQIVKVSVCCC